ncbi:glycerophosphodiester phosphodiesterase [Microlunatus endophyticus]|uniref:glycerophosphodiester phosphodiesterase n=1 Tax=Microlunatus endophyticus TaxID=1716077 RepID=UPI00166A11E5|nr:glycerophosphodiester phosphodiesterase [Microlunatus endophyticus]
MRERFTRGGAFHAVAHRGDPRHHRENTLPSIDAAIDAGAEVVEIDIKTTADAAVVVLHDDTLERLWGVPRPITGISKPDLDKIGDDDHRIPLLSEVLEHIGRSSAALLIDMDDPAWAAPGLAVVGESLAAGIIAPDQVLWCGRPDSLTIIRDADPEARIIFSWDESDADGRLPAESMINELSPEAFNPHWPMINDAVMGWATDHGLAITCWTVDDPELMQHLLDRGIDGITTNRIHQLQELRHDR